MLNDDLVLMDDAKKYIRTLYSKKSDFSRRKKQNICLKMA